MTVLFRLTFLLAPLQIFLAVAIFGSLTPGYSQSGQWISELAMLGAPHSLAMTALGTAAFGGLLLVGGLCGREVMPRDRRFRMAMLNTAGAGACIVVAGVFRCDDGCPVLGSVRQIIHNLSAATGFTLLTLAQLSAAREVFLRRREASRYERLSAATFVVSTVLLIGVSIVMLMGDGPRGVVQKGLTATICGWLLLTVWREWSAPPTTEGDQ